MIAWVAALALDLALGEPPERAHPVVLVGRAIDALDKAIPDRTVAWGALVALLPAVAAWSAGAMAPRGARLPLLKSSFALRELVASGARVERALRRGDLAAARAAAARIVGRPTAALDEAHLASAAIESLSENLADSYVAPLFWYAVAGLPGALAYRAVNTSDAMIGHHSLRHERVGKVAARLDDALGYVPARIAAGAIVLAAPFAGGTVREGARVLRRDGARTPSPNSGRPMAAAAGALGVWLEKPDHHRLGAGRAPTARDIARARVLVLSAAAIATLAGLAFAAWRRR